jgi:predicted nucleic acid-binding protein
LVLDAGAVLALSRNDVRARAALAAALEAGADISIPAVVVAETVRGSGPRDAPVNRVVKAVGEVTAADEAVGRTAGSLLAAATGTQTIDALVVADVVCQGGGVLLTGDRDDIERLAGPHPTVVVQALSST